MRGSFDAFRASGASWLGLLLAACSGAGQYAWVKDLPPSPVNRNGEYMIREGDVLDIRVFNQDPLSTHVRVRSDGCISMFFLGDVEVRGKLPSALKADLERRLKDYVNSASITVNIAESQPITVSVLGEVGHQGAFPVDPRVSLGQVLALAGGLTDYASRDRIFVVRTDPSPERIRFKYEDISRGEPLSTAFALHQGDLIVVE